MTRRRAPHLVTAAVALVALAPGVMLGSPTAAAEGHILVAAGNIAGCDTDADEETARLLDGIPGTVAALGDNAYESGSAANYRDCYGPTWGRHLERTRPTPGNHDYDTPDAAGYFSYFGRAAGERGAGYYSYQLGAWHIVALNSNCEQVGCGRDSAQRQWLRDDLRTHRGTCTLAYWHHPRFSSGAAESSHASVQGLWEEVAAAGVDVVLSAHSHHYERFAPQNTEGLAAETGPRQFVVGTGGRQLHSVAVPLTNSEAHVLQHGVLELTLGSEGYQWRFVTIDGTIADAGSDTCAAERDTSAEIVGVVSYAVVALTVSTITVLAILAVFLRPPRFHVS